MAVEKTEKFDGGNISCGGAAITLIRKIVVFSSLGSVRVLSMGDVYGAHGCRYFR